MLTKKNKTYIQSRAPLRLGLAGGGSDVSPYYEKYGGVVLNATLNRYAYTTILVDDEKKIVFHSTDFNETEEYFLDQEISLSGRLDLLKATYLFFIKKYNNNRYIPLKLTTFCDSPIGSGLGSSSTLVVSLVKAFDKLLNTSLNDYEIADITFYIERVICGHKGGKQDQYSATFGGINYMEFYDDKTIVTPLRLPLEVISYLESSLILYYTGQSRVSGEVIEDQVNSVRDEAHSLQYMHNIKKEAMVMKEALLKSDFDQFRDCINEGWLNKKLSSNLVSNKNIDDILQKSFDFGALAGKVSGAGGGGFIMFYVNIENRNRLCNYLSSLDGYFTNCHFTKSGATVWVINS